MATVSVMRFNQYSGCICVDKESWFLRNRKSFFSDSLFSCIPEYARKSGLELFFGGVGYPPFHYEVYLTSKKYIEHYLSSFNSGYGSLRVEDLARFVLKAFQDVHTRKINNRLNFFFGFTRDDFTAESYRKNGSIYQIKQEQVKKRAENIIDMKEKPQDITLVIPPNEACVAGIASDGFHAYCIKEQDGVLSFYSCGFDCLGVGKYAGGSAFANTINKYNVEKRRKGFGKEEGVLTVFNALLEGWEHYSQIGGNIRLVLLSSEENEEHMREISDSSSYICIESVKAFREDLLSREDTLKIITSVMFEDMPWQKAEALMFEKTSDTGELDKCLRNYKMDREKINITSNIQDFYKHSIL